MKLSNEARVLETNIQSAPESFQIAATPQAFKILSGNLYSDRITAIIRELICNAVDSHRAAGIGDEPIEVHLPTFMDAEFRVRDHGTGMSHDTVLTLYRTYFGSDKNHTNNLIGGLGLGSKSPFSYTDQFTVHSWYNGAFRVYQAYIQQDGTPAIMQVGDTRITDQPNGIEIVVPVRSDDTHSFVAKYREFAVHMPVQPSCEQAKDLVLDEPLFEMDLAGGGRFLMYKQHSKGRANYGEAMVRMDIVTYRLRDSAFDTELHRAGVMELPIGAIDVSPNRESLSPTEAQKRLLQQLYEEAQQEANRQAWEIVAKQPTLFDALATMRAFAGSGTKVKNVAWVNPANGMTYTLKDHYQMPEEIRLPSNLEARRVKNAWRGSKLKSDRGLGNTSQPPEHVYWREKQGPFIQQIDRDHLTGGGQFVWVLFGPAGERDEYLEHFGITEFTTLAKQVAPSRKKKVKDDDDTEVVASSFAYGEIQDNNHYWSPRDERRSRMTCKEMIDNLLDQEETVIMTDADERCYYTERLTESLRTVTGESTPTVVFVPASHKRVRAALARKGAFTSRTAYAKAMLTEATLTDLYFYHYISCSWNVIQNRREDQVEWNALLRGYCSKEADDPDLATAFEQSDVVDAAIRHVHNPENLILPFQVLDLHNTPKRAQEKKAKAYVDNYTDLLKGLAKRYPLVFGTQSWQGPKADVLSKFYFNHIYQESK